MRRPPMPVFASPGYPTSRHAETLASARALGPLAKGAGG
jgi:hypothetical protein